MINNVLIGFPPPDEAVMVKAPILVLLGMVPLLSSGGSEAGCPAKQTRDCVINLDAVPQISQQIVSTEQVIPKSKTAPGTEAKAPYTGPTLGITPTVRQYPTVGYRWSFD
jgi:hypothetical protein